MQIEAFEVRGLFGRFDHSIHFPILDDSGLLPSCMLVYGPNGVGKTTMLRLMAALLRSPSQDSLFQSPLFAVPFQSSLLKLSGLAPVVISSLYRNDERYLVARYEDKQASVLIPRLGDPKLYDPFQIDISFQDLNSVLESFMSDAKDMSFDLIETKRIDFGSDLDVNPYSQIGLPSLRFAPPEMNLLSEKLERFVRDAQVDSRAFFSTGEPELFQRIIDRLRRQDVPLPSIGQVLERIHILETTAKNTDRFGLDRQRFDVEDLVKVITESNMDRWSDTVVVVDVYLQQLEALAQERSLIADRLSTFERVMSDFFVGKSIRVNRGGSFSIISDSGGQLNESQLSSGERHLLYLMVAATTTRRTGTVLAIDEPELSMHLSWQRRLVLGLIECAAHARPQFVLATHSPDIGAGGHCAMTYLN